jgi:hypothetical protein
MTNMGWRVGYHADGLAPVVTQSTVDAAAYPANDAARHTKAISIPTHTKSMAQRDVKVWGYKAGTTDTIAPNASTASFSQAGATLSPAAMAGATTIPAAAANPLTAPTFSFDGTYDGPITLYTYVGAADDGATTHIASKLNGAVSTKTGLQTAVTENNSLTSRELTFHFQGDGMAANKKFGDTYRVTQSGKDPTLNLIQPATPSNTLDLDNANERTLKFNTNAHWTLVTNKQPADADYDRLATAPTLPTSINKTNMDPSITPEYTMTFTPATGATDTEPVNTVLQPTLKLQTYIDETPLAVSKDVVLQRKAVGRFDGITFTPSASTLPATGAFVTALGLTNMKWWVGYSAGSSTDNNYASPFPAQAYDASNTQQIDIPANTKSMTERTVNVWGNNDLVSSSTAYAAEYTQDMPTLNFSGWASGSGNIPQAGAVGDVTTMPKFNFTGTYDGIITITAHNSTGTQVGSYINEDYSSKTGLYASVNSNSSTWGTRDITFKYTVSGQNAVEISPPGTYVKKQDGYSISGSGASSLEGGASTSYMITISSTTPARLPSSYNLRAFPTTTPNGTPVNSNYTSSMSGTGEKSLNFTTSTLKDNAGKTLYIFAYNSTLGYSSYIRSFSVIYPELAIYNHVIGTTPPDYNGYTYCTTTTEAERTAVRSAGEQMYKLNSGTYYARFLVFGPKVKASSDTYHYYQGTNMVGDWVLIPNSLSLGIGGKYFHLMRRK